ncbi:hypothetical protein GBO05_17960 [Mycobacterium avium subsp. hominissuis]|uniref:hypothetical protein n=1 Tax=Mycobacterium avium TaxID=1764 RepID=UPI001CC6CD51|nr:hypothetical protein [Mycobacterium avium]MBZ4584651.1 hypothetical protein [Mycobacterium avium subsp. hominissuis]
MADEDLDTLYWVPPQQFTAERARLAAAASARGDDAAAQRISAARKPTAAAWIVNRLALRHKDARQRLADLGERLRAAHAALDGARIRELSAEQHRLIDELTGAALRAADVRTPSAALREDLTGTLQAAVADPQVRARLGRLTRPERWSSFGDLGDLADVGDAPSPDRKPARAAAQNRHAQRLRAAVAAAEDAKARADAELSEGRARRDAARQRRDAAARELRDAERELRGAEGDYDTAEKASRAAAETLQQARARLQQG